MVISEFNFYLFLGPHFHRVICPVVVSFPLLSSVTLMVRREGFGIGGRIERGSELRRYHTLLAGLCKCKF